MNEVNDQMGRRITLKAFPQRIVSLVPSQSELLCDLNLENELLGISKFCVHPTYLTSTKTIVGGTKKVNFDKIKAIEPDFILCNKEENTLKMVSELEQIAPVYVSDVNTIQDSIDLIDSLGIILNRKAESKAIIQNLKSKLEDFNAFIADQPTSKVAYFIWAKPWMAVGNKTFINEMLSLNKFENVYAAHDRYPEVNIEKMGSEFNPELVILSSEPFPFKDKHAQELRKYCPNSKIVFGDGEFFSWFGSRILLAFEYFKELHKELHDRF